MKHLEKKKQELASLKTLKPSKYDNRIRTVDESLFFACKNCGTTFTSETFTNNFNVCSICGKHYYINSRDRIKLLVDKNTFIEINSDLKTVNNNFPGYFEKIESLTLETGLDEAVITGFAEINSIKIGLAVMDSSFLMGSMGEIVGEKITRLVEESTVKNLPIIIFTASGGARMQEGIVSLMQMAKTSAAIKRHSNKGLLYISVFTHPTTGGVTASFASLGDIQLAEPEALIGFAGPRVIEQTIKQKLPNGFQTSEYLLENGFIDKIVERKNFRNVLSSILSLHGC